VREANGIAPDITLPTALPLPLKNAVSPYLFLFSAYLSTVADTVALRLLPEAVVQTTLDSVARYPEALTDETDKLLEMVRTRTDTLPQVRQAVEQARSALFQSRLEKVQRALPEVTFLVTQEVLYRQAGEKWAYAFAMREDPWIQEARRLLESPQRYQAILKP
jgi:hypothetical protein